MKEDFIFDICNSLGLDIDGDTFYAVSGTGSAVTVYVNLNDDVIKVIDSTNNETRERGNGHE